MDATEITLTVSAIGSVGALLGTVANYINAYVREQRARRWAIEDKNELAAKTESIALAVKRELELRAEKAIDIAKSEAKEVKAVSLANYEKLKVAGDKREANILAGQDEIKQKVDENTQVSVEAFKEANGVNAKLLTLGVKIVDDKPNNVVVVNSNPIKVTEVTEPLPKP